MEAEVVRMAAKLFNGDDDTVGTMTSGIYLQWLLIQIEIRL